MLAEVARTWCHGAFWGGLAYSAVLLALAGWLWWMWRRLCAVQAECVRERRGREEMEAYTRLDVRPGRSGEIRELASRVCGVVAARSPFKRVAMLVFDAAGRGVLAASEGLDDETRAAIEEWARPSPDGDAGGRGEGVEMGCNSVMVTLDCGIGREPCRIVVIPFKGAGKRSAGALVVCANSIPQVSRRVAEEAVIGLEALAVKLGRAMESAERTALTGDRERSDGLQGYPLEIVAQNRMVPQEHGGVRRQ